MRHNSHNPLYQKDRHMRCKRVRVSEAPVTETDSNTLSSLCLIYFNSGHVRWV